MTWAALEAAAPALAREGWARFSRTRVAMLATLRADGSPRISPVEPYLLAGQLVFGVMPSPKLEDLEGDARIALHSSVSDVNGTEGEFKVSGRAIRSTDPAVVEADETWWTGRPPDRVHAFAVDIAEAILVAWNTDQSRMTTLRWTPEAGARTAARTYP